MRPAIIAAVLLAASPAAAQLSQDAYTWGAEVHNGSRSTVISARKAATGWAVTMECSLPGRGGREKILKVQVAGQPEFELGSAVRLFLDPLNCHLFDGASGDIIAHAKQ